MSRATYDAIVIGAGIIGACTAYELAKRGMRVLVLDRLPAAGYGSTSFSCAIIRTHYSTLTGSAMAFEGYHRWRDWQGYLGAADERGYPEFRRTGCLLVRALGQDDLAAMLAHTRTLGIPYEEWDAGAIKAKLPFIDLRAYAPPKLPDHPDFGVPSGGELDSGVFFPIAGYISDPQLAAHNAQRAAEARGASFRFNAEVAEIRETGGRVGGISLKDGEEIDAPVVVNVGGPHSSKINKMAGVADKMALTTGALRQEVAYLPGPPDFDFEADGTIYSDNDIGCYARPENGNRMVVGSVNPECDGYDIVDADDFADSLSDRATAQVMRLAQRIPTLGIPGNLSGIVACYDVTPDWIPIYDRSDLPGFYMAVGTSGNQFKNAPVAGDMMAELIVACENGRDHDADPLSFELPHLGRSIDIGFFSRNRRVNADSSFSVLG